MQTKQITLYGMLKSGVGRVIIMDSVRNRTRYPSLEALKLQKQLSKFFIGDAYSGKSVSGTCMSYQPGTKVRLILWNASVVFRHGKPTGNYR